MRRICDEFATTVPINTRVYTYGMFKQNNKKSEELSRRGFGKSGVQFCCVIRRGALMHREEDNMWITLAGYGPDKTRIMLTEKDNDDYEEMSYPVYALVDLFIMHGYKVVTTEGLNNGKYLSKSIREDLA